MSTLADVAEFPDDTTHVQVDASDYTVQVPIRAALDGILALDRERGDRSALPRLIASGISGERLVKRVRRVSAVALAPGEDPVVG